MNHDLFALWRDELGFGAPVYATDSRPFHPIGAFLPANDAALAALFLIGAVTIVFATRAFVAHPSRLRWLLLTATVAIAITGCAPREILLLLAVAVLSFLFSAFQGDRRADGGAIAGGMIAIVIALLLSAGWWMPLRAVRSIQTRPVNPSKARSPEMFNTRFLKTLAPFVVRDDGKWMPGPLHEYVFGQGSWFFVDRFDVETSKRPFEKVLPAIADFRTRATVDHIPAPVDAHKDFPLDEKTAGGVVNTITPVTDGVRLDVQSRGWNLLVSNRAWWPGWRAYLRKERLRPVRVNGAFVGVFVPGGSGEIQFRYRPREVDDGLRAGAVGLLLAAITTLWPWYRRFPVKLPGRIPRMPRSRWRPDLPAIETRLTRAFARVNRRAVTAIASLALIGYALFLLFHSSVVAAGADSSGYLNQARLWRAGHLVVPIPMVDRLGLSHEFDGAFAPLGFMGGTTPGTIVPTYPPGFPLHLAIAEAAGGRGAIGAVVPLCAAGSAVLLFLLARMLGVSRAWAIAGTVSLCLSSVVIFQSVQPMTDVPAMFWSLATIVLVMKSGNRRVLAAAAGAAFAIGVLVRPTNILLLPAALILLRRRDIGVFALGGAPFALLLLATNEVLFGSPFKSGYGPLSEMVTLSNINERLPHYSMWLAILFPLFFPFGLIGLSERSVSPRVRLALLAWFAPFFVFYCFYSPYEAWWYTRFLLPAVPPVILLLCIAFGHQGKQYPLVRNAGAIAVTLLVIAAGLGTGAYFEPWDVADGEAVYREAVLKFRPLLPRDGVVLATQLSGALFYYAGHGVTRLDYLDPSKFEQVREAARIRHIPIHAILFRPEEDLLRERAPGDWVPIARFRAARLYQFRGPSLATSR